MIFGKDRGKNSENQLELFINTTVTFLKIPD
jgi:hypothetical protein